MRPLGSFAALSLAALITSLSGACRTPYPRFEPREVEPPLRVPFSAPDAPLLQRTVTQRTLTAPDGGILETTRLIAETEVSIASVDGGYQLTQTLTVLETSRADDDQAAFARVFATTPLLVSLAPDGSFVRLLNGEALSDALQSAATDEASLRYARRFTPELLEEDARAEWQTRYGAWFGRNLNTGQIFYSLEELPLGGGRKARYVLERTIAGLLDGAEGRGVLLSLRCLGSIKNKPILSTLVGGVPLEPSITCEGTEQFTLAPFGPTQVDFAVSAASTGGGRVTLSTRSARPGASVDRGEE